MAIREIDQRLSCPPALNELLQRWHAGMVSMPISCPEAFEARSISGRARMPWLDISTGSYRLRARPAATRHLIALSSASSR